MRRLLPLLVLAAFPSLTRAQTPHRDSTLFFYAFAAGRVHDLCKDAACSGVTASDAARAIFAFVEEPLAAGAPPSLKTIDTVFARVSAGIQITAVAPQSGGLAGPAGLGSTVVVALSQVFIERARAELVASVFRDLDGLFQNPRFADLRKVLPTTARAVHQIDQVELRAMLPTLRTAMEADVRQLPIRLADTSLTIWHHVKLPPAARAAAALAIVAYRIHDGAPPLEQLAALRRLDDNAIDNPSLRGALRSIGSVAADLLVTDKVAADENKWYLATRTIVARLTTDTRALRVYARLLLNEQGLQADEYMADAAARVVTLVGRMRNVAMAPAGTLPTEPTPLDFLTMAADIAAIGTDLARPEDRNVVAPVAAVLEAVRCAVAEKDYSKLVLVTLSMLEGRDDDTANRLRRLITLAGALSTARTADAAAEALTAWADPVGSFRDRRQPGQFRLAIVGYLGAGWGEERITSNAATSNDIYGHQAGAFAPLGIELSLGTPIGSVGLLGSVLDLGALTSFQLSNSAPPGTAIETMPEVSLRNVVAPGVWVTLGLSRRYPITLGAGLQRAPRLRTVSDGLGVRSEDAVRRTLFAAVDLTLFRLVR